MYPVGFPIAQPQAVRISFYVPFPFVQQRDQFHIRCGLPGCDNQHLYGFLPEDSGDTFLLPGNGPGGCLCRYGRFLIE